MTPTEQQLKEQRDKEAAANQAAMAPIAQPFKPAVNPPVFQDASLHGSVHTGSEPFHPGPTDPLPTPDQSAQQVAARQGSSPSGGPFTPAPTNPMPFAVHEAAAGPHPADAHLAQQVPGSVVGAQYPRTLSNPDRRSSPDGMFTELQDDGRYAASDMVVADASAEEAARKDGFTVSAVAVEPCPKCGSPNHHPEVVIDLCGNCGNKFQVNRKEGQTIRWVTT